MSMNICKDYSECVCFEASQGRLTHQKAESWASCATRRHALYLSSFVVSVPHWNQTPLLLCNQHRNKQIQEPDTLLLPEVTDMIRRVTCDITSPHALLSLKALMMRSLPLMAACLHPLWRCETIITESSLAERGHFSTTGTRSNINSSLNQPHDIQENKQMQWSSWTMGRRNMLEKWAEGETEMWCQCLL